MALLSQDVGQESDNWLGAGPRHAKQGGWVEPEKPRLFNPSPPPRQTYLSMLSHSSSTYTPTCKRDQVCIHLFCHIQRMSSSPTPLEESAFRSFRMRFPSGLVISFICVVCLIYKRYPYLIHVRLRALGSVGFSPCIPHLVSKCSN